MKNPNSNNGKSILFTCQNEKSLVILERDGRFINKKKYIQDNFGDIAPLILNAYDWFVHAASMRLKKPEDVQYQIWCTSDARLSIKPEKNEVLYILEVPDEQIIYFNCFKWDYILNLHYVPKNEEDLSQYVKEITDRGFENSYEFISGRYAGKFPLEERRIKESWNRIFDIDDWNPYNIQANIWEIKKEWVKDVIRHGEIIPEKYYFKNKKS